MKVNTIIMIGENQDNKKAFMDILNKEMSFSYTKIEAIFQASMETFPEKYSKDKLESFYEYLENFLKKLRDKNDFFLLDIDDLSVKNANLLAEKNDNILVIYLKNTDIYGKVKYIDINNVFEVQKLVNEIKEG